MGRAAGSVGLGVCARLDRLPGSPHLPHSVQRRILRHGHIDFHHGVYFPARGYREGYNPSSNAYVNAYPLRRPMALYSPAAPLVFLPLGCLTLPAGDILYFGINALLTGTAAYAALRISGIAVSPASLLALTAAIIVSRPGHINLALGQITLPLVLGSWAALEWGARRPGRAALGLCVAALKPTFGIPLLWLTFCRGNRRAALWGGLLSASIAALAAGIEVARSGWPQWLDDLRYAASFVETSQETIPTETWTRIDGMVLLAPRERQSQRHRHSRVRRDGLACRGLSDRAAGSPRAR